MKRFALAVVGHPNNKSFCHAMSEAARGVLAGNGFEVRMRDLYAEGFDPVRHAGEGEDADARDVLVEIHAAELAMAELVLVFHPNWWGQPPAIVKGWVDRVFRLDTAYAYADGEPSHGFPKGLLTARAALVFNTSNTLPEREQQAFGDPLQRLWRDCIFGLCGVSRFERRMFGPMGPSSPTQRQQWLDDVQRMVQAAAES